MQASVAIWVQAQPARRYILRGMDKYKLVRHKGTANTGDPRWHPQMSCGARYPGLEGIELQSAIFADYLVSADDIHIDYFSDDGQELLSRHAVNSRDMRVNREDLVESIKKEGLFEGVSGQAWVIPSGPFVAGQKQAYQLLSHATRAEAVYLAWRQDNTNTKVIQTIQQGIMAKVLDARTPVDVLTHLKLLHNAFHKTGAGTSHIELYDKVDEIEAAWKVYCREQGLSARNMPTKGGNTYFKAQSSWLNQHYPKCFKNMTSFVNARGFLHAMRKDKLYDDYKQMSDSTCHYAHPRLDIDVLIACNHQIQKLISTTYSDTIPKTHLHKLMLLVLRMCLPGKGSKDDPEKDELWIIDSNSKVVLASQCLCCPVTGTVAYKPGKRKREKDTTPKPKADAGSKASSDKKKFKHDMKFLMGAETLTESVQVVAESSPMEDSGSGGEEFDYDREEPAFAVARIDKGKSGNPSERKKLILDDVYAAIMSIMEHIPEDKWVLSSIDQCWREAVYFLLEQHGLSNAFKEITKYSALRYALRQKLAFDHRGLVNVAIEQLPDDVTSSIKSREAASKAVLQTIIGEHEEALSTWFNSNDMELPVETLNCYTVFLLACKKTAKGTQQMNSASMIKVRSLMHQNTRMPSELTLGVPAPLGPQSPQTIGW